VRSTASLVGGGAPKLSHDATPALICRQSSEAVIFLTSTYQARYSLKHPPPVLPHVVFAAILHQLTLLVDPRYSHPEPTPFVRTPSQMPPQVIGGSPAHPLRTAGSYFPRTEPDTSRIPPPPLSPTLAMQAQRAARRRASAMSSVSACPSTSSDHPQSSVSDFTSSTASERGEASSSNTSFDILPAFTSAPADLVTVGSLQLVSMGAQQSGAANAARLLHGLGSVEELIGSNIDLSVWARSLPLQVDDFVASTLWTGLGLERDSVREGEGLAGLGVSGQPQFQGLVGVSEGYARGARAPLEDMGGPRTPVCA